MRELIQERRCVRSQPMSNPMKEDPTFNPEEYKRGFEGSNNTDFDAKGKRKFSQPVCITLNSDGEEEKSDDEFYEKHQSSPAYQNESEYEEITFIYIREYNVKEETDEDHNYFYEEENMASSVPESDGYLYEHSRDDKHFACLNAKHAYKEPKPEDIHDTLFSYPPSPQRDQVVITNAELQRLNPGEFLNDAIIDFYLKYLYNENLTKFEQEQTFIFSSYFFGTLTHKPEHVSPDEVPEMEQLRRHSQVKTWTRHDEIFDKNFIIIPINEDIHWFLAIVCYPGLVPEASENPVKVETNANKNKQVKEANSTVHGKTVKSDESSVASYSAMFDPDSEETMDEAAHPEKTLRRKEVPCICIFDSLNRPNRSRIVTLLREYLETEWKMRKGTRKIFDNTTMPGYIMQCPQQTNNSDCGIYVLQYVESFFENPISFDSPPPNLSNWFPKEKVAKKRQELQNLILFLSKKYSIQATLSTTI